MLATEAAVSDSLRANAPLVLILVGGDEDMGGEAVRSCGSFSCPLGG